MSLSERLRTRIVPPDGPLDAAICLIGEAPGKDENASGVPFKGAAGRLLNQCLRNVGLVRSEVLVYNVFKQQPPGNNIGYYFSDKSQTKPTWEGQEHIDSLREWLQDLKDRRDSGLGGPNIIVALGAIPLKILTGHKRITKWRGSLLPCTLVEGFKVYATFHPSYVNRLMNEPRERLLGQKKIQMQNALPLFLKDLTRIREQSGSPIYLRPQREFVIAQTLAGVQEEFTKLDIAKFESAKLVAVDIETLQSAQGPLLWCIGFSPSPGYAFTIPFVRNSRLHWTLEEEAHVLVLISKFFLSVETQKVFQGGLYDLSILGRYYGLRLAPNTYQDTMLCHHASYPYIRKALEVLVSIHTWEPYYKDDGKVWDGRRISDESEYIYNCRDCCLQREIFPHTRRDSEQLSTWRGYQRTISVLPSILGMQVRGIRIDIKKKDKLAERFSEAAEEASRKLCTVMGGTYNLESSSQMIRLLYTDLQLPIQYNHKTKRPAADKDAINRLLKQYPKEYMREYKVLRALSNYRKFSKLASTYTSMEVDEDGRIHTSYGWVSTYRLSSSESPFGGGGNLQNIPVRTEEGRLIRELFIPDEGHILLACDLKQAEAQVVAWLAQDIRLIELFESGEFDVHWERTKSLFGIEPGRVYDSKELIKVKLLDEAKPMKFFRNIGKTTIHAFNYKMGPIMLQNILIREGVYLDQATCKHFLANAQANNPLTVRWQQKTIEEVRATRVLITPLGRKREFRGRLNDELYRSAIAFIPQSTVGEMPQLGIQKLYHNSNVYQPLLNVHDEVVGQCKPEHISKATEEVDKAMTIPLEIHRRELIIGREFKLGPNWGQLKERSYDELIQEAN